MSNYKDQLCQSPLSNNLKANWIWFNEDFGHSQRKDFHWRNSYTYFRKKIKASGKLKIHIAAETQYDLFVDGKRIDRGTTPSDVSYKIYDTHHIEVSKGDHVIAVMVHHIGQLCGTYMKSRPGLFVQIETFMGKRVISDLTWKVMPSEGYKQNLPCMMSHFGFYEVCDFSKEPQDWKKLDFDDTVWPDAEIIGKAGCKPWIRMVPRSIPLLKTKLLKSQKTLCLGKFNLGICPVHEEDITVAVEMANRSRIIKNTTKLDLPIHLSKEKDNEFIVLDFGREISGHLKINLSNAKEAQCVEIGYDEKLDKNGIPDPRRTYVHFADRYYLRKGQKTLEVFGARGFRYLLIDVHAGKGGSKINSVTLEERTYPINQTNKFECSDDSLNYLYKVGLETLRLCMFDTYVDCPSRERIAWMDSYLGGMFTSYGMGITKLWRENLLLHAQNICKDGLLVGAVKGFVPCDYNPVTLTHAMYFAYSVSDYLMHSGDYETAKKLFSTVLRQFEILGQFENKKGLIDNSKWHGWRLFQDWSAMDNGGVNGFTNAAYILMHKKTAELAIHLKRYTIAKNFKEKSQKLIPLYKKTFFKGGIYLTPLPAIPWG